MLPEERNPHTVYYSSTTREFTLIKGLYTRYKNSDKPERLICADTRCEMESPILKIGDRVVTKEGRRQVITGIYHKACALACGIINEADEV